MSYLLDTNVMSETRKRHMDHGVRRWLESVEAHELFTSVLVLGEIQQGIERLRPRDPVQATHLAGWLDQLRTSYHTRIVPISLDIGLAWGRLNAVRTLPLVDGLLAATAVSLDWTLVTRNERDVTGTGVSVLNPFSG